MKKIILSFTVLSVLTLSGCGTIKKVVSTVGDNFSGTVSETRSDMAVLKNTEVNGVKQFTLVDVDYKDLSQQHKNQLNALARQIKALGPCEVTVIGHTDSIGDADVNQSVSDRRAALVRDYLQGKGVSNIYCQGVSYYYPAAGNDSASGRAQNRRVEIFVSTAGKYNPYK